MNPQIERISEGFILSESPHWDAKTQNLYYVDIFGKKIFRYNPTSTELTAADLGKQVTFIVPVEGSSDRFVIGLENQLAEITWDGSSPTVSKIEVIAEADEPSTNRFNDGKADPSGKLWAGTMGAEPQPGKVDLKKGNLYSLEADKKLKRHVSNIHISNGLAWNSDMKKFFYIDSGDKRIDQFDYDVKTGTISNRRPLFTLKDHQLEGTPDGQAVDKDDNLWVALFNGYKVIKIATDKPETLLGSIDLPAKQVTSVAFGGPDLDTLYVTTANMTVRGNVLATPENGSVYKITGVGAKGVDGAKVKL